MSDEHRVRRFPAASSRSHLRTTFIDDPEHGWLVSLMLVMTGLSGVIDAVSIIGLGHVFVANMTGALLFCALGFAGASGFSLAALGSALGGFVLGALVCRAVIYPRSTDRGRLLWHGLLLECAALATATAISFVVGAKPDGGWQYTLLVIAAIGMGTQNSVVFRLGVPDMTTTVVTRAVVGLATGLGRRSTLASNTRQLVSIVVLLCGGFVGALLTLNVTPATGLLLATALAISAAGMAWYTDHQDVAWKAHL